MRFHCGSIMGNDSEADCHQRSAFKLSGPAPGGSPEQSRQRPAKDEWRRQKVQLLIIPSAHIHGQNKENRQHGSVTLARGLTRAEPLESQPLMRTKMV